MVIEPNLATLVALLLASVIMWIKTDVESRRLQRGQAQIHELTNSNLQVVREELVTSRKELADARRMLVASLKEVEDLKGQLGAMTARLEEYLHPRTEP